MNMEKAAELVLKASHMSKGGEAFILKMSALRIKDLAEAAIEEMAPQYGHDASNIKLEFIGKRNGEKMYEELMNEDEAEIAEETEDMFMLPPYDLNRNNRKNGAKLYKSKDYELMKPEEIRRLLKELEGSQILEDITL